MGGKKRAEQARSCFQLLGPHRWRLMRHAESIDQKHSPSLPHPLGAPKWFQKRLSDEAGGGGGKSVPWYLAENRRGCA